MSNLVPMGLHIDEDLITAFAAHQRVRGFSPRTVDRRTWSLTHLAAIADLDQQTPTSIEVFLARWPSPQSRYSIRSDVHQFYKWAMRRDLLHGDPTLDVDPPRLPRRTATPLTPADLQLALHAISGDVLLAVKLGAYAGLRCSEMAALDRLDVLHEQGLLVVRCGKGGHDEVIPLAPELAASILPGAGPVVHYCNGQSVGDAIRREFRKLGIPNRPHDLRHTFGTAAARLANGNMVLVAALMRHASITTTQRYVRWNPAGADVVAGLHAVTPAA
jgi:integrase